MPDPGSSWGRVQTSLDSHVDRHTNHPIKAPRLRSERRRHSSTERLALTGLVTPYWNKKSKSHGRRSNGSFRAYNRTWHQHGHACWICSIAAQCRRAMRGGGGGVAEGGPGKGLPGLHIQRSVIENMSLWCVPQLVDSGTSCGRVLPLEICPNPHRNKPQKCRGASWLAI